MRILHTSDWHLGRTLEGRARIQEQRDFLEELKSIVEREDIHLVLVAGDVFDTYNPSAEAEELFYGALEGLAGNGRRAVVVIAGNHDSPDRLHAANPLAERHGIFLMGYPGENLFTAETGLDTLEIAAGRDGTDKTGAPVRKVAGGPGWLEITVPGCVENAVVAALPYPSEQRLNEVLADSLEDSEMQKAYSGRVFTAFQQAAAYFRNDTVNLAVSHLYVLGGLSSDSEREIQLGGAYVVEPAALPANAHYVALGHLHRPQKVGGTQVPARYSGSPLCYSFSEADQQKEVVRVEAAPGQDTVVTPVKLTSGKPMRFLRFDSHEEAYRWCEAVENQNLWVDMEIGSPLPLESWQVAELRKLHTGIINIRIVLPGPHTVEERDRRLSELSLEEKFSRFAARETGNAPPRELFELFIELLEGGEELETGQA
ncbi:MAG: metallophosphoesterase family protein [Eubacteriales bacterium]